MSTPTTAKGTPCKLCSKSSNGRCHLHGHSKSSPSKTSKTTKRMRSTPKSSPKKIVVTEKGLLALPCDVLLQIAGSLNPKDYAKFALVSKALYNCLDTGRFSPSQAQKAKKFLKGKRKEWVESTSFEHFESLPLPALYQVLLKIQNRQTLNQICNGSRKAAKICSLPRFQREYDSRWA